MLLSVDNFRRTFWCKNYWCYWRMRKTSGGGNKRKEPTSHFKNNPPDALVNSISQVLILSSPAPHCQDLSLKTNIYLMFIMCQLLSIGFDFIILRKLIIWPVILSWMLVKDTRLLGQRQTTLLPTVEQTA